MGGIGRLVGAFSCVLLARFYVTYPSDERIWGVSADRGRGSAQVGTWVGLGGARSRKRRDEPAGPP